MALCPGLPRWAGTRKVKPIWILLEQETVSGSGIISDIQVCTSLQTDNHASTPPLSFYRPDALPAAQPTASKHWRHDKALKACQSTVQSSTRQTRCKQYKSVNTYIDLCENINKSTVVIRRPAKCLEHSKPLWTQSIAACSQLSTQTWNVIQPATNNKFYKTSQLDIMCSHKLGELDITIIICATWLLTWLATATRYSFNSTSHIVHISNQTAVSTADEWPATKLATAR